MKDHMEYTASIAGQKVYGQIWEVEHAEPSPFAWNG